MLGKHLDDTLTDMDFKALYMLAEYHDKQATIIRARAHDLQCRQDIERRSAMRVDFLKSTPKVVARYLKQGHDIDRAIALAADHTSLPESTVRSWWDQFLDDKQRKAVRQRNNLAYDLAALGLTNVKIAERLGLHPVSVCRIVKKERLKRIYNPNTDRLQLYPPQNEETHKTARRGPAVLNVVR